MLITKHKGQHAEPESQSNSVKSGEMSAGTLRCHIPDKWKSLPAFQAPGSTSNEQQHGTPHLNIDGPNPFTLEVSPDKKQKKSDSSNNF